MYGQETKRQTVLDTFWSFSLLVHSFVMPTPLNIIFLPISILTYSIIQVLRVVKVDLLQVYQIAMYSKVGCKSMLKKQDSPHLFIIPSKKALHTSHYSGHLLS